MEGDAGLRSVRVWRAQHETSSGQRSVRRSVTARVDSVIGIAANRRTVADFNAADIDV